MAQLGIFFSSGCLCVKSHCLCVYLFCFPGLWPFYGRWRNSVIVDAMFIAAPSVCGGFVLGFCFVMQYLVSFVV